MDKTRTSYPLKKEKETLKLKRGHHANVAILQNFVALITNKYAF
ncbi:hypothetical protein HNR31_001902 [Anoxybacillus caldiproteolyticus]|uniref:Uncharacterized protein n=1 Tax=Thermaerobacillus caldiproteolyticus TaxID=247480 RepID=A0A7V9Z708_9BACL|nr:hypothetical protein [Anoxybacillus caldiproteolyticus]